MSENIQVVIDPAVTVDGEPGRTCIVVTGEDDMGRSHVIADYSMRGTPDACMKKAVWAYHHHHAARIAGKANNGGDLIERLLRAIDPSVRYRKVITARTAASSTQVTENYVCDFCDRNQCARCRDVLCTCCAGNNEQ